MPKKDKEKVEKPSLKNALRDITEKYGKESVVPMGGQVNTNIDRLPTGIKQLDEILGGGIPKRRIIELYGSASAGKTSLAMHIVAQAQKAGLKAAYVDLEGTLDMHQTQVLGVNVDDLYIAQSSSGEEALEIVERLAECGEIGVIVLDSVSAVSPRCEIEGDLTDSNIGAVARLMGRCMRRLAGILNKSKGQTICIFINQIRVKPGVLFGNPEYTSGGNSLKFYASVRLDVRQKEVLKDGDIPIGIKVKAKTTKNKCAVPFRECTYDLLFATGFKV